MRPRGTSTCIQTYIFSYTCTHTFLQNVTVLNKECETQRHELRKFQGASYVMQQRIIRETQRLKDMTRAKGKLAEVCVYVLFACMMHAGLCCSVTIMIFIM